MTEEQMPCGALQQQTEQTAMQSHAVNERVLLAAQPQPDDWQRLAAQGYHTILNIRSDPARAAVQQQAAEQAGLRYIYVPVPAYELGSEHLAQIARLLDDPELGRTVLHCRSGTRVGLLWLLYRTVHQGVSPEAARAELQAAGYDADAMDVFEFCAEDFFERTGLQTAP